MADEVLTGIHNSQVFPETRDIIGEAVAQSLLQGAELIPTLLSTAINQTTQNLQDARAYVDRNDYFYSPGTVTNNMGFNTNTLAFPVIPIRITRMDLNGTDTLRIGEDHPATSRPEFRDTRFLGNVRLDNESSSDILVRLRMPHSGDVQSVFDILEIPSQQVVNAIDDADSDNDGSLGEAGDFILQHAGLRFGIQPTNTQPWAIAALAQTFLYIHGRNPNTFSQWNSNRRVNSITTRLNIQGNYVRSNLASLIVSPGQTNDFSISQGTEAVVHTHSDLRFNYIRVQRINTARGYTRSFSLGGGDKNSTYTFTVPVSDSAHDRITVFGLHQVEIDTETFALSTSTEFERGDEGEIIVPLLDPILRSIPYRFRDNLALGSTLISIRSFTRFTPESNNFFDSSLFRTAVTVVAAIASSGASLPASLASLTVTVVREIFIALLIDYTVQFLLEEIGGTLGVLLIALTGIATGQVDFSTLATTLSTGLYPLYTASVRAYGAEVQADYESFVDEQSAFASEYDKRLKQLEYTQNAGGLGLDVDVDYLSIIDYRTYPNTTINEEPQQFFDRTSTIVDLSAVSISLVNDYHSSKLALPVVDSYIPALNGDNTEV